MAQNPWNLKREKTTMLTTITKSRKLVPQRGWSGDFLRAFSTVSSSCASQVKTTLCSAPWNSNTRRMSFMRLISRI